METKKLSCSYDKSEYVKLTNKFRFAAFLSVVISTAALLGSALAVPAFYHYALTVNNLAEGDYEFCRIRTSNLWSRLVQHAKRWGPLSENKMDENFRISRKAVWSFVNPNLDSNPNTKSAFEDSFIHGPQFKEVDKLGFENDIDGGVGRGDDAPPYGGFSNQGGKCCTCQQGPAGPQGLSGKDGADGSNGGPGTPGRPGEDAPPGFKPPPCQRPCPPGPPGQAGLQGEKGPTGVKGSDGQPGPVGPSGERGPPGVSGNEGPIGAPGDKGLSGEPGRLIKQVAPQGPPGANGAPGPQGPPGLSGGNGKVGPQGSVGEPGDQGDMGFQGRPGTTGLAGPPGGSGQTGSCTHCPPPRLPPGY